MGDKLYAYSWVALSFLRFRDRAAIDAGQSRADLAGPCSLTFYVMAPLSTGPGRTGIPAIAAKTRSPKRKPSHGRSEPFGEIPCSGHVREPDSRHVVETRPKRGLAPFNPREEVGLRVLIPALHDLGIWRRRLGDPGFIIALPSSGDPTIMVATILMSMGMMYDAAHGDRPAPSRFLFFILIDGWNLLVGGLVRSFF